MATTKRVVLVDKLRVGADLIDRIRKARDGEIIEVRPEQMTAVLCVEVALEAAEPSSSDKPAKHPFAPRNPKKKEGGDDSAS